MKQLLTIILLAITTYAFSQNWPVKQQVLDKKARQISFITVPAFRITGNQRVAGLGEYQQLQLNASFIRQIMSQRPEAIRLQVPLGNNEILNCELIKAELGNVKFTENNSRIIPKVRIPVTYRGIVTGEQQKNNVLLTVNDDYISLIATFSNRAIQITKANETALLAYRLYNSQAIRFPATAFDCGTKTPIAAQTDAGIKLDGTYQRTGAVQDKCVQVFVDCFDSLYQWRGNNRQQTINYVYELFNLVIAGYLNDSINIQVMGINVWTMQDPYRQGNRDEALADLSAFYKEDFWGNLCVGLDFSISNMPRFGLAGDRGRVKGNVPHTCNAYTVDDHPFCYNDLNYGGNYQNFPTGPNTTQGQLYLVMHEMGHLLGSAHTQWCGWQLTPTTTGAIDNCSAVEGSCTMPPAPPPSGGTIMSYCIDSPQFVNYNNGFGPLPGNAIRNFVNQNPCIQSCMACLGQRQQHNHSGTGTILGNQALLTNSRQADDDILRQKNRSVESRTGNTGGLPPLQINPARQDAVLNNNSKKQETKNPDSGAR